MFTDVSVENDLHINKLSTVTTVLKSVANKPEIYVSGSLSEVIARKKTVQEPQLTEDDLIGVGDIDLLSTTFDRDDIKAAIVSGMSHATFQVELAPVYNLCMWNKEARQIATSTYPMLFGAETVVVRYTTPAFLLLSLVSDGVTNKTPAEKLQAKIARIQGHPAFNAEDFIDLTTTELKLRGRMNNDTYRLWREHLQYYLKTTGRAFVEVLKEQYEDVSSLVDQAELFNRIHTTDDLLKVPYRDVRKISLLEQYVTEFKEAHQSPGPQTLKARKQDKG